MCVSTYSNDNWYWRCDLEVRSRVEEIRGGEGGGGQKTKYYIYIIYIYMIFIYRYINTWRVTNWVEGGGLGLTKKGTFVYHMMYLLYITQIHRKYIGVGARNSYGRHIGIYIYSFLWPPNLTNVTNITYLQALIDSSMSAQLRKCNETPKKFELTFNFAH